MQSVPNPRGANLAPEPHYAPTFVIELEPWWRVFARNLGDLFRPAPPQVWLTSAPGQYWEDALVRRPVPWSVIFLSCVGHALLAFAIYGITWSYLHRPRVMDDEIASSRPLEHFELSEYLPAVNSKPQEKPQPVRRRQPQQADPEYARQEIVSIQEQHDSIRQTIVNPVTPKMLKQDFPLPNIVAWTPVPSPAPVVANHSLTLPLPATPVIPPPQETARRNLNALQIPLQPQVVQPAETPMARNLAALDIPVQPQAAVPPSPSPEQHPLGDVNFALDKPTVEAPKLPTPEEQAASGTQQAQVSQTAGAVPSAQPITASTGKAGGKEMGQLLALNVQPVMPSGPMTVPEGNRRGEFAAGPTGRSGASGRPEILAGENTPAASGKDGNSSLPGNIFVAAPPRSVPSNVVVANAALPSAPIPKSDTHGPFGGRDNPGAEKFENQVFGDRKYYSMSLNMPNLTSTSSSWIIRFAEMNPIPGGSGDGLSAPVALSKVDPAYPAALMRDRVEGIVVLYAVIHSDGSVADVKVLQGVQDTLDENARDAMQKWHFRPGTKNGSPVDIEAVIKIPFRAPRKMF